MARPKLKLTYEIELPTKLTMDSKVFDSLIHRVGPKIASRARKRLRQGTTYEGNALPASTSTGESIDLRGDTNTLLRSIKYNRRLQEIAPFGPHPRVSKRAGQCYGLMQILMSGKDRNRNRVRAEFDPFGVAGEGQIYEDAAAQLQTEIDNAVAKGKLVVEGHGLRKVKSK